MTCPADPDGCTPETCTHNDCKDCGAASNPTDRTCYRCGAALAGAAILMNVNEVGLRARRGIAIEEVQGPRAYRPGTLEVLFETRSWAVYIDGVRVATRPTYQAAEAEGEHRMRSRR